VSARPGERGGPEDLDAAVELLERSLGYTRVALADVTDPLLPRPTPCATWTLADLLAHMEDALDAFTEAAGGGVGDPVGAWRPDDRPAADRVAGLQRRACALLGVWSADAAPGPLRVTLGDRALAGPLLVRTAALEIAVHGWDVARTTGRGTRIPEQLGRALLATAVRVVGPADRGVRFAAPRPAAPDAAYDERLLLFLGRDLTGPGADDWGNPGTRPGLVS
jgi:uncharacterized protein (TIGR03086 family)